MPDAFIRELVSALRENPRDPFRETILLAPSYRVGRQWLDAVALREGGVTNVRVMPLARLMLDCAEPRLAKTGMRPGRSEEKIRLAGLALSNIAAANRDAGYFTRLPVTLNLAKGILGTLEEMEDAGVMPSGGFAGKLVSREKGDELAALLTRCRAAKKSAGIVGNAEIADAALRAIREGENASAPPLLLIPESIAENATARERTFLAAWPRGKFRMIPEDDSAVPEEREFFRADSTATEAREILRRIRSADIPLDRVEIVPVDPASFIPALCAAGLEWFGGKVEDLPFTFHSGIPGSYSRPARLLAAWLDWIADGIPAAGLADMLQAGFFGGSLGVAPEPLASRLKALPIHGGGGDGGGLEGYRAFLGRGAEGELRDAELRLLAELSRIVPQDAGNAASVLRAAGAVLAMKQPREGKLDAYARVALLESVRAWTLLADWPEFDAMSWLADLARGLSVMGLPPLPGRLHVSDIYAGGHSGREVTFLAGLDDARFPGGTRQDPVLLDKERVKVSRKLAVSPAKREKRTKAMGRFLSRVSRPGGKLIASYAGYDAAAGREVPASLLFRRLAGERIVHSAVLLPSADEKCLTRRDAWLREVLGFRGSVRRPLAPDDLAPFVPNLAAGEQAHRARLSGRFTGWDGIVPEAGEDFSREEWALSPSQLEMLARCPMDFFFRKVLGVKPPKRHDPRPGEWLRGNERGELLHDLFQNFMMALEDAGETVAESSRERLSLKLMDMLETALRHRRGMNPPRDQLAYERDRREMIEACVIFLFGEIGRSERGRPLSWEAALGGAAADAPPWNRVEPIRLDTSPGRPGGTILLQGRVDRIDRLRDGGGLVIWDYKTGRSSDFSRTDPFRGGRHLQPFLYTEMLERATREAGLPEPVKEFSYLFPMRRDEGNVITFSRDDLRGGMEIVAGLRDMLRAGRFPFAAREEDAAYSDYLPVYDAGGGMKALCAAVRLKTENHCNISPCGNTIDLYSKRRVGYTEIR